MFTTTSHLAGFIPTLSLLAHISFIKLNLPPSPSVLVVPVQTPEVSIFLPPLLWYLELCTSDSYSSAIIAIPSHWVCYFILFFFWCFCLIWIQLAPHPPRSLPHNLYTHATLYAFTNMHTHIQFSRSSALPHKNSLSHTHAHTQTHTLRVSAGVVPDRNKWQLPNYLLTVDAYAAWDALLIFLFLLPPLFPASLLSLSPSLLFLFFLPTSSPTSPVVNYACPKTPNLHSHQPCRDQPPIRSPHLSFSFLFLDVSPFFVFNAVVNDTLLT